MAAVSAELCFVGIQSPAEGDVVFSNTVPSCSQGTWTLPSVCCSNAFLFPFLRVAITGPNAIFFLALFFLGLVMKVSLDGIWGQNKAAAEEFRHKNQYCILPIKLCEVKQDLYFQISMSTTANAARIVLLSVHGYN